MKHGLMVFGIALIGLVAGAFIFDALMAKPQREILIDHDYVPGRPSAAPAPADDNTLIPLP